MRKEKITARMVSELKPGNPGKVADLEQPGLQLWIGVRTVTWYYCVKRLGTQYHIRLGDALRMPPERARREARAQAAKIDAAPPKHWAHSEPIPFRRTHPTVGEIMDFKISRVARISTRRSFEGAKKHLSALLDREVETVKRDEIRDFRDSLADRPGAANQVLKCLSAAISSVSFELGIDLPNPVKGVALYREEPRKRFLDEREAPALVAELERLMEEYPRARTGAAALLMMVFTGQRKGNVCSMDYAEIDARGMWTIPGAKAKEREPIQVPLNSRAMGILRGMAGGEELPESGPVFKAAGKAIKYPDQTFRIACRNCGISNLRIHDLRRTLASWMLMSGADIATVSRTLGHSSIAVTEHVYAHLLPGKIAGATERALDAMMGAGESGEDQKNQ